ncbi:hypothetical protein VitviT2T_007060 [Vitis vinifera]|uniref:RRM domain-containing protein n=1 Tax=Vitis vinifera TaxID=29760 RepID=A0ABY9BY23_VITVI|nr:hypothetical protein VitviT2T_007060 [Vitis vinifera]
MVQHSVAKNADEGMRTMQSKDQGQLSALANTSRKIVNISVSVNTWKPAHYQRLREVEEEDGQKPVRGNETGTGKSEGADSRTIFVNNVHFTATKVSLSRHFNEFGEVVKVIIVTDAATRQPKGSDYVEFMRKEAARHALSLDGTSFMSRILKDQDFYSQSRYSFVDQSRGQISSGFRYTGYGSAGCHSRLVHSRHGFYPRGFG